MSYHTEKAKRMMDAAKERKEAILALLPEKYHVYVLDIEQRQRFAAKEDVPANDVATLQDLGVSAYKVDLYINIPNPYLRVAGRVAIANDYCRENDMAMLMYPTVFETQKYQDREYLRAQVRVEIIDNAGKVRMAATGTSTVGITRNDTAMEKAETNALGRALGNMGFGVCGSIATAEEMEEWAKSSSYQQTEQQNAVDYDIQPDRIPAEAARYIPPETEAISIPRDHGIYKVMSVIDRGEAGKVTLTDKITGDVFEAWFMKDAWKNARSALSPEASVAAKRELKHGAKDDYYTLQAIKRLS